MRPEIRWQKDRSKAQRRWNDPVPLRQFHPPEFSAFHGGLLRQLTFSPVGPRALNWLK